MNAIQNSIRWTIAGVLILNSLLKFIILHDTEPYSSVSSVFTVLHLTISSFLEHGVSIISICWFLWCTGDLQLFASGQNKFLRKLYFSLAFSEYFKVVVIVLQIFDSEPRFFFLFGVLLASIQFMSLRSLINHNPKRLFVAIVIGNLCRFLVRIIFYDMAKLKLLGLIA